MARKMKDSGIEWIGEIPEEWTIIKAKHLFRSHKDIVGNKEKEYERLSLTLQGVLKRSKDDANGLQSESLTTYQILNKGELVFKMIDLANISTSRVGYSPYTGIVSPVYIIFENKDYSKYGYYYFYNMWQRNIFNQLGNNGVRSALNVNDMLQLPFPKITKEEATKIADFLNEKVLQIDSVINETKETIEDYKKYKQAIITEAVTKGLNPNVVMKESKNTYLGAIPIHWNEKKLRFLGTCQNGISKSSDFFGSGYPFVSYGDVYRNYSLPQTVNGLINSTDTDREIYSVEYGDVFFTRTSETIEEVGFSSTCLKTIENATFAGFVIRFRPFNAKELIPEFSKYYFRSNIHRKFFVKEMNLVTRASLSQELLKKLPVLLPPKAEQKEIAAFLDKKCSEIDKLITKKESLIADLEAYKKSLIYEYVTGKKEVPESKIIPFPATINCKDKRFAQAVLFTKILDEFGEYHSGRVKVAKTLYVIENHIGFDFDTDTIRKVAGPLDEKFYKAEAVVRHNKWFNVLEQNGATRYFAGKDKQKYLEYYNRYFKDYDTEIQRIIDIFKDLNMNEAELLATAYASWNDAIIKGNDFSKDELVDDIFSWDDSKKRFPKEKWLQTFEELEQKNIVPVGHGKMTIKEKE